MDVLTLEYLRTPWVKECTLTWEKFAFQLQVNYIFVLAYIGSVRNNWVWTKMVFK